MKYYNNILETIGNTPLVKLNKLTSDIDATILAKQSAVRLIAILKTST